MIIKKPSFAHIEPQQQGNLAIRPMIKFGHTNQPIQQLQTIQSIQRITPQHHFNEVRC